MTDSSLNHPADVGSSIAGSSIAIGHFSERTEAHSHPYLDDRAYGQALSAIVIACVDLLFCQGDRRLLGLRRRPPRAGWWVVGGRMFPGESPQQAACRKAQEEAGIAIDPAQLVPIGIYSTVFAERSQPPTTEGLHSVNVTFGAIVTAEQAAQIRLSQDEYSDYRWVRSDEFAAIVQPMEPMDRALLQIWQDGDRAIGSAIDSSAIDATQNLIDLLHQSRPSP